MSTLLTSTTKWAAGIVGSVLTAILIWYIEKPPPPPPPPITLEGRVVDNRSREFIHNAHVRLRADTYSGEQFTDSDGRYYFLVRTQVAPIVGQLRIEANGYQLYDLNSPLNQGDNIWEIPLELASIAVAPTPFPPVGVTAVSPSARNNPPRVAVSLPSYVRRPNAVMIGPPPGSR